MKIRTKLTTLTEILPLVAVFPALVAALVAVSPVLVTAFMTVSPVLVAALVAVSPVLVTAFMTVSPVLVAALVVALVLVAGVGVLEGKGMTVCMGPAVGIALDDMMVMRDDDVGVMVGHAE